MAKTDLGHFGLHPVRQQSPTHPGPFSFDLFAWPWLCTKTNCIYNSTKGWTQWNRSPLVKVKIYFTLTVIWFLRPWPNLPVYRYQQNLLPFSMKFIILWGYKSIWQPRYSPNLFHDYINVSRYEPGNILAFACLHCIIGLFVVIAKIQCERIGRCSPLFDTLERIDEEKLFGFLVNAHYGLFGNAKQACSQLVLSLHFFFDKKECDAIGFQWPAKLCVFETRFQFAEASQSLVFGIDFLLDALGLNIFLWQELFQTWWEANERYDEIIESEAQKQKQKEKVSVTYSAKPLFCVVSLKLPISDWHCSAANFIASFSLIGCVPFIIPSRHFNQDKPKTDLNPWNSAKSSYVHIYTWT